MERTFSVSGNVISKWPSSSKNTWEPQSNLNCPVLLRRFLDKHAAIEPTVATIVRSDTFDDIFAAWRLWTVRVWSWASTWLYQYGYEKGQWTVFPDQMVKNCLHNSSVNIRKGSQVRDVVPAAQANIRCPQIVIKFYESILHFTWTIWPNQLCFYQRFSERWFLLCYIFEK